MGLQAYPGIFQYSCEVFPIQLIQLGSEVGDPTAVLTVCQKEQFIQLHLHLLLQPGSGPQP